MVFKAVFSISSKVLVGFFKIWYHMIHLSPLYPEMPLDMMESDLKNFYAPGALWAPCIVHGRSLTHTWREGGGRRRGHGTTRTNEWTHDRTRKRAKQATRLHAGLHDLCSVPNSCRDTPWMSENLARPSWHNRTSLSECTFVRTTYYKTCAGLPELCLNLP